MTQGANKIKKYFTEKFNVDDIVPPPPAVDKVDIKKQGTEEEEPTVSLGYLKYIWSGGNPKHWDHSVPTTPMPICVPPKRERPWSYEIILEHAQICTEKLNFYKERKRLKNIVSMSATDNNTIILLEVYD